MGLGGNIKKKKSLLKYGSGSFPQRIWSLLFPTWNLLWFQPAIFCFRPVTSCFQPATSCFLHGTSCFQTGGCCHLPGQLFKLTPQLHCIKSNFTFFMIIWSSQIEIIWIENLSSYGYYIKNCSRNKVPRQ